MKNFGYYHLVSKAGKQEEGIPRWIRAFNQKAMEKQISDRATKQPIFSLTINAPISLLRPGNNDRKTRGTGPFTCLREVCTVVG